MYRSDSQVPTEYDHSQDWNTLSELDEAYNTLQTTFRTHLTLPIPFRQHQLLALARLAQDNAEPLAEAIYKDLGRHKQETYMAEIGPIVQRSLICARKVGEWSGEERRRGEEWMVDGGWKVGVRREAKGVVLVISPWNYPLMLSLQPLYGAISAGCCALIKLSEFAPHYSALLSTLLPKYLDTRAYKCVRGGVPQVTHLLEKKFDHIFYTGNPRIARLIAAAAAKHLTPCTLELGGKSPVLIDENLGEEEMEVVARRVVWGKINNSGQICVTPDYTLLPRPLFPAFLTALRKAINEFFPEEEGGSLGSASFGRVVSEVHFRRLVAVLEGTKGEILIGGRNDEHIPPEQRRGGKGEQKKGIEVTVVKVERGDVLLEGELFGPILPILLVDNLDEAIEYVRERPHPLVIYAFTKDEEVKKKILERTNSGNIVFGDTFGQMAVNDLPFGGVGESGYGRNVLKYSFDIFTYERAHTDVPLTNEHMNAHRYPPYTAQSVDFFKAPALEKIPSFDELQAQINSSSHSSATKSNGTETHEKGEKGGAHVHGVLGKILHAVHADGHSGKHEGSGNGVKKENRHEHDGISGNVVAGTGAMGGSGVGVGGGNFQL